MFENMRNKHLKFDNIEFNGRYVKNSTDLILLPDMIEKYLTEKYISEIEVSDNRFLEGIAHEVWGTTDYWDVLMLINGMKSMDCLPLSYDYVLKRSSEELTKWKKLSKLTKDALTTKNVEDKYNLILNEQIEKNEKYRTLKYVSIEYIDELITDLDALVGIPKINSNLIINKDDIKG